MTRNWHPASFRDPSGYVFRKNGEIFRQLNNVYQPHYRMLMDSGLYRELTDKRILLSHAEVKEGALTPEEFLCIYPEQLDFISYPYEWCFSQLKDAALATLEVQEFALKKGMTLKDASAFNIQFQHGNAVFIDTLSFESYEPESPWVAYRQFCEHFLAPLALMARTHISLSTLFLSHPDGIPLELASSLLPFSSKLDPHLCLHLHVHQHFQKKYSDKSIKDLQAQNSKMKANINNTIESLQMAVSSLSLNKYKSIWSSYYQDNTYTDELMQKKAETVIRMLASIKPGLTIDFGANTGKFSKIAAEHSHKVIALDLDPFCIELFYKECREKRETKILPLVSNLCNPSPAIGWYNKERASLPERLSADCGLVLALMHHLHVSGHIPIESIAEFFADLCKHLIIEFVPLEDPQTQRLLASRLSGLPSYNQESFCTDFEKYFSVKESVELATNGRKLFRMESKKRK